MKWDEREATFRHLEQLERDGKAEIYESEVKRFDLRLRRAVGDAMAEEDENETGLFNFTITLGPVNARKLIDFLQTLPDEPEEDEEPPEVRDA